MSMPSEIDGQDMQGLLLHGYKSHIVSCFLLLRFGAGPQHVASTKQWLAGLQGNNPTLQKTGSHFNIAFTYRGLERLGCPPAILSGFSDEFIGGMTAPHRRRILGDSGANSPEQWLWGNAVEPVDAALLLYARTAADLAACYESLRAGFAAHDIAEIKKIDTCREPNDREHFGFHDSITNPTIAGLKEPHIKTSSAPVKAGEFILGYENEYRRITARPVVDRALDPRHLLKDDVEGSGGADFGRNGSYLVFRQLYQDVHGFWSFIDQAAGKLPGAMAARGPSWLGAKMIGRWQSGAPIARAPDRDDPTLTDKDDFLYRSDDPSGVACPIGAHIRRANPRDGFMLVNAADSAALSNRHRLLRRGRSYGPVLAEPMTPENMLLRGPDGVDRGLCFICLTANISRQFEFVQGSWMNDPSFNTLHDDVDPLLGQRGRFSANPAAAGSTFTIPAVPVRARLYGLPNFVTVRGGAYFFLPGKAALRYLAQ